MDTREKIMMLGRAIAQAHGYTGVSFRELAKAVGVKSASIHHHFPTKADLGEALARRYCEEAATALATIRAENPDPAHCLTRYAQIFRRALEAENRMCMIGQMGAEHDDLPEAVQAQVLAFADLNVGWLSEVLGDGDEAHPRALAIYAAIAGAQLTARSRGDIAIYDAIIESYRATGLIPA